MYFGGRGDPNIWREPSTAFDGLHGKLGGVGLLHAGNALGNVSSANLGHRRADALAIYVAEIALDGRGELVAHVHIESLAKLVGIGESLFPVARIFQFDGVNGVGSGKGHQVQKLIADWRLRDATGKTVEEIDTSHLATFQHQAYPVSPRIVAAADRKRDTWRKLTAIGEAPKIQALSHMARRIASGGNQASDRDFAQQSIRKPADRMSQPRICAGNRGRVLRRSGQKNIALVPECRGDPRSHIFPIALFLDEPAGIGTDANEGCRSLYLSARQR